MEITSLFRPLHPDLVKKSLPLEDQKLVDYVDAYVNEFPDWEEADIVIVGCGEDKGASGLSGAAMAPDEIRQQLYKLSLMRREVRIADLGNLVRRDTLAAYYDGVADVITEVVKMGKTVLLLGGSQDIAYGQYMGYGKLTTAVEYVAIDSRLDVQDSDFGVNNTSYNHKIFVHSPNFLGNYTNLGYQTYFTTQADIKRMKNLYFQAVRLGEIRKDIKEAEPYLRNADMVSFDMSAVRSADAPGTTFPSPAGFTAEEACQLARFIGMANRVSSMSICEIQPRKDFNGQAALLAAMMSWYFIEGVYARKVEEPENIENLKKYTISLHNGAAEIVFLKSPRNERWWMEVPYPGNIGKDGGRTELIPCSEKDYQMAASQDEIPEKWWMVHHRLK